MKKLTLHTPADIQKAGKPSEEDFFEWLMENREFAIGCILRWCSDFTRQDAEDVFSRLCERLVGRGKAMLGEATRQHLIFHLRREKENFRRWKNAAKRGGKIHHESIEIREEWHFPSENEESTVCFDLALAKIDGYLKLLSVEATGRLAVLAGVMRRVLKNYRSPLDLFHAMTEEEKLGFLLRRGKTLQGNERKVIMKQISRTLEELRKRLRQLRRAIAEN